MENQKSTPNNNRPDLSKKTLVTLLFFICAFFFISIFYITGKPGIPILQSSAILGSCLLLLPVVFSVMKRSGYSKNPPFWFVVHVISSGIGAIFIFFHVANGNWLSPPGVLLLVMIVVIVQGILARSYISQRISYLFAKSTASFSFGKPLVIDTKKLQIIIDKKVTLVALLDPNADEALFSPTLQHWLKKPITSFRYHKLAMLESKIVGARIRSGFLLRWWRLFHIVLSVIFLFGMIIHIIVVVFFAGYAAGDEPIYWWYITDWGG